MVRTVRKLRGSEKLPQNSSGIVLGTAYLPDAHLVSLASLRSAVLTTWEGARSLSQLFRVGVSSRGPVLDFDIQVNVRMSGRLLVTANVFNSESTFECIAWTLTVGKSYARLGYHYTHCKGCMPLASYILQRKLNATIRKCKCKCCVHRASHFRCPNLYCFCRCSAGEEWQ